MNVKVPVRAPAGGRIQVATRDTAIPADEDLLQDFTTASHSSSGGGSTCPFLAALPRPPPAQHKWWQRPKQLFDPVNFQPAALGPHRVVQAAAEMLLPGQIIIGDGELARQVLGGEGDITLQGNFLLGFGRLIGTQSLLAVQEPQHKYLRALIMPAFEKPAIERLVPRMEAIISKYLSRWCEATAAPGGATVKATDEMKTMTFDFIINVIMGRDFPEEELASLIVTYKVWVAGVLDWPFIDLPFTRFGKALKAREELMQRLQVDVDKARQQLARGEQPAGILGSLVAATDDDGNRLTDAQVRENLLLLLLAGHDTSAVTLTNIMADLQRHPAVVQRLREEQQQVVATHGDKLSGAALKDMEYAEAVIRETLRLMPVVPSLSRVAAKDFDLGGYAVKKGEFVVPALLNLSATDPRWTEDEPQLFKPERMMTPEGQKRGWLMPFGYGPRFCAGYSVAMAEMKSFLALLARGYEFEADVNTKWVQRLGRVPENGLPMKVSPLKQH